MSNEGPVSSSEATLEKMWGLAPSEVSDLRESVEPDAKPRQGIWSIWSCLAWVATRSEQMTAAVQLQEQQQDLNDDATQAAGFFLDLGANCSLYFGTDLLEAEDQIREGFAQGVFELSGMSMSTGRRERLDPFQAAEWTREISKQGVNYIPGYTRLAAKADDIVRTWPNEERSSRTPTDRWSDDEIVQKAKSMYSEGFNRDDIVKALKLEPAAEHLTFDNLRSIIAGHLPMGRRRKSAEK